MRLDVTRNLISYYRHLKCYNKIFQKFFVTKPVNVHSEYYTNDIFVEEGKWILNMALCCPTLSKTIFDVAESKNEVKLLQASYASTTKSVYKNENKEFFYQMLQETSDQYSARGIVSLIESSPVEVMTSKFCTFAITHLIHSDSGRYHTHILFVSEKKARSKYKTILKALVDRLILIGEPMDLLKTTEVLLAHNKFIKNTELSQKLINQIVKDILDGIFSLRQVISAMILFSGFTKQNPHLTTNIQSMWLGLQLNLNQINHDNLVLLFQCLELVPECSIYIRALIDRIILLKPIQFTFEDIIKILQLINRTTLYSENVNMAISRWIAKNIYALNKVQFSELLLYYSKFHKHDANMTNAIQRYLKVYHEKMEHSFSFTRIVHYLIKHRVSDPIIMDLFTDILINHSKDLKPKTVQEIFHLFGYFCYLPNTEVEFWKVLETYIQDNFFTIAPHLIAAMLLTCAQMENYTLKFIRNMFNPKFKDFVKKCYPESTMQLLTYDQALRFENKNYDSPIIKTDFSFYDIPVNHDIYVRELIEIVEKPVQEILSAYKYNYRKFFSLDFMPKSNLYNIDIFAYPEQVVNWQKNQDFIKENRFKVMALLIKTPEHLIHSNDKLIGPQRMRRRHLNHLGIHCIDLSGDKCLQFKPYPKKLYDYLKYTIGRSKQNY